MSGGPAVESISLPALAAVEGRGIEAGVPSDRWRLAILLQGAGLLSHLRRAGWRLADGWRGAHVDDSLTLCGLAAEPGRQRQPQLLLVDLAQRLFGGCAVAVGRGAARRVVGSLEAAWNQAVVELSPDLAVQRLLQDAAFLWQPAYAPARRALVGSHLRGGRSECWVAGPARLRRLVLAAGGGREGAEELLGSTAAEQLYRGVGTVAARVACGATGGRVAGGERLGGASGRWEGTADQAFHSARGARLLAELERALARRRRQMAPSEAAQAWGELARLRRRLGRLAAAERAERHRYRLLAAAAAPPRLLRPALLGLVVARIRRGCLAGIEPTLVALGADARHQGVEQEAGLAEAWARLELARGRPAAALVHLRAVGAGPPSPPATLLTARAMGWLGRRAEAAAALAGCRGVLGPGWLEAEELPALWLAAGDRARALAQVPAAAPVVELWRALLMGGPVPVTAWAALDRLQPYRRARLVFDLDLLFPAAVPACWLRGAALALRRAGATALAERLEGHTVEAWRSVDRYLRRSRHDPEAFRDLLTGCGFPEARLSWSGEEGEILLVEGPGGRGELSAPLDGGRLVLRAAAVDATLETLFSLVLRDARPRPPAEADASHARAGLVGRSRVLRAALERLSRLATCELPILILGETGTGKELAARRVHALSARSDGPFLPVNCAALSETLLLSDLFGHARGAFTGADRERAGVFESARQGTVFLDEVGDLPPAAQGMLLRVLQEGEVRRVGESLPRRVDVRVVAATHRDLERMVATGEFRRDLLYRLQVGRVELPPLRDRGRDVLLLAEHFLARGGVASRPLRLSAGARSLLLSHGWPGNVRELEGVVNVASALAEGPTIEAQDLDLPAKPAPTAGGYHGELRAVRRRLVSEALTEAGGNRAQAARRLGVSRQALSYLVRQLGVT